jgi:phosphate uptake regulator
MDDDYLLTFSKDLREAIKKKTKKSDRGYHDLEETIYRLEQEIKFLKAEVKYERELRLKGAKYHNG